MVSFTIFKAYLEPYERSMSFTAKLLKLYFANNVHHRYLSPKYASDFL